MLSAAATMAGTPDRGVIVDEPMAVPNPMVEAQANASAN
jgi:hypothetical protein